MKQSDFLILFCPGLFPLSPFLHQHFDIGQNQRSNAFGFIFYNGFPHVIVKGAFPVFPV